jgi:hypothetical protein
VSSQPPPKKKKAGNAKTSRKLKAAKKKQQQEQIDNDIKSISLHFEQWHALSEIKDLNELKQSTDGNADGLKVVPTYIGALNSDISDTGMVSFVRHFSKICHQTALTQNAFGTFTKPEFVDNKLQEGTGVVAKRQKRTPTPMADSSYGCTFVLFTTAITTVRDVVNSDVKMFKTNETDNLTKRTTKDAPPGGSAGQQPTESNKQTSALVCTYLPSLEGQQDKVYGSEPLLLVSLASTAEVAIHWSLHIHHKGNPKLAYSPVTKIAILGFGMLQAGLTVQTYATHPSWEKPNAAAQSTDTTTAELVFCPQWLALATSAEAALDSQLQIAGRSFVELKGKVAPTASQFPIHMLGVTGAVKRLQQYSEMEYAFARVKNKRMFEALKGSSELGKNFMAAQTGDNKIGVVGVRRVDFASILGLSAKTAIKREKQAEERRARALVSEKRRSAQASSSDEPLLSAGDAPGVLTDDEGEGGVGEEPTVDDALGGGEDVKPSEAAPEAAAPDTEGGVTEGVDDQNMTEAGVDGDAGAPEAAPEAAAAEGEVTEGEATDAEDE